MRLINWIFNSILRPRPMPQPAPQPPKPQPAPTPPPSPQPQPDNGVSDQLLQAHNAQRQLAGLSPLTIDSRLEIAALKHAAWMAASGTLDHNENGVPFDQRIRNEGYQFWSAGENIAAGQTTVQQVMSSWMNSSGHRQNILSPKFRNVGFGYAAGQRGVFWCVDFAAQANAISQFGPGDEISLPGAPQETPEK